MPRSVEILKDKALIRLNKGFYNISAIKQTAEAFKEICNVEIKEDNVFELLLSPKEKTNLKELALEFSNYALGMMK